MSSELLNAQNGSQIKLANNISVSGNSKRKLRGVSKHSNMRNKDKRYATTLDSTYGERLNSSVEYALNKNTITSAKKKVSNVNQR